MAAGSAKPVTLSDATTNTLRVEMTTASNGAEYHCFITDANGDMGNTRINSRYYDPKGALLYGVIPVCALCEAEHPGHLNVRGALRHCVPNKGLHPLRRFGGYPCRLGQQKRFYEPFPLTKFLYRKSNRQYILAVIFYPNL